MNCRRQSRHRYFCFRLRVVPFLTTCREAPLGQVSSAKHTLHRLACSSLHHKFSITTPDNRVILSWVEKAGEKRYALRFAARDAAGWSEARTAAEGENWFITNKEEIRLTL